MEKINYSQVWDQPFCPSNAKEFLAFAIMELISQNKNWRPGDKEFSIELKIDGIEYSLQSLTDMIWQQLQQLVDTRAKNAINSHAKELDTSISRLKREIENKLYELFPNASKYED